MMPIRKIMRAQTVEDRLCAAVVEAGDYMENVHIVAEAPQPKNG